jgi:hypothetical protein
MSNKLIYNINSSECVGDSLSKHNYNTLSLDTTHCNLSSTYFTIQNNYWSVFMDLSDNINKFNEFASIFANPSRLNRASSATSYLSSYWQQSELTLTFPINIYQLDGRVKYYIDENFDLENLKGYAFNKLNSTYPPNNFIVNTKANVVFLLYSNNTNRSSVVTNSISFGITNKIFNITARKEDVYISKIKILQYYIHPTTRIWTYQNIVL